MESLFHLQERGTTLAREVRGGLTTFLTMAYILFANPSILCIVATTALALATGQAHWPTSGAWLAMPHLETFGAADLSAALHWSAVPLVLSLMMVDFFDTLGTATAVVEHASLMDPIMYGVALAFGIFFWAT